MKSEWTSSKKKRGTLHFRRPGRKKKKKKKKLDEDASIRAGLRGPRRGPAARALFPGQRAHQHRQVLAFGRAASAAGEERSEGERRGAWNRNDGGCDGRTGKQKTQPRPSSFSLSRFPNPTKPEQADAYRLAGDDRQLYIMLMRFARSVQVQLVRFCFALLFFPLSSTSTSTFLSTSSPQLPLFPSLSKKLPPACSSRRSRSTEPSTPRGPRRSSRGCKG
jgi:hypothetical protein